MPLLRGPTTDPLLPPEPVLRLALSSSSEVAPGNLQEIQRTFIQCGPLWFNTRNRIMVYIEHFLSHLNEENAERDCADEIMESRLFSVSSSHRGSTCLSDDASLPSATAAELVLAIASELAANLVWISARGDSRKWQTHADGSRKVSTTTSP